MECKKTIKRLKKVLIDGIRANVMQWIGQYANGIYFMAYMEAIDFLNDLERKSTQQQKEPVNMRKLYSKV